MSTFGEGLIQSLNEALAHAKGEGLATVHTPGAPREVRKAGAANGGSDGRPGEADATSPSVLRN